MNIQYVPHLGQSISLMRWHLLCIRHQYPMEKLKFKNCANPRGKGENSPPRGSNKIPVAAKAVKTRRIVGSLSWRGSQSRGSRQTTRGKYVRRPKERTTSELINWPCRSVWLWSELARCNFNFPLLPVTQSGSVVSSSCIYTIASQ